jgi:hypothetical protein
MVPVGMISLLAFPVPPFALKIASVTPYPPAVADNDLLCRGLFFRPKFCALCRGPFYIAGSLVVVLDSLS